ncbi:hypothetical protein [Sulfolobus spindle-shaped virus]|nr:hypothetical protein [Sulfolobus spindle-shaped virus]AZG03627.1 hypothetical protein [Sulfolobus spindle-shaped virus]AZG03766.1 hypothetical protein [Sulfolobus spindle-shaped virus]AZG03801.1 hypothetical protein [Sulfolobus spindle-shaped virus]AZG03870.1 hypothetical protein [Sulfolobus spindle-shaped virus]
MSSSCKEFDGIIANEKTIERAKECLHLAFLYIDRTVDPPIFRYMEPDDSYEIIGWKREENEIYYILRLKDGKVLLVDELELKHLDSLLRIKKKFNDAFSR